MGNNKGRFIMPTIQGIYDGVEIKPKEAIPFNEECEVIMSNENFKEDESLKRILINVKKLNKIASRPLTDAQVDEIIMRDIDSLFTEKELKRAEPSPIYRI
jgi:hypothetical protein